MAAFLNSALSVIAIVVAAFVFLVPFLVPELLRRHRAGQSRPTDTKESTNG